MPCLESMSPQSEWVPTFLVIVKMTALSQSGQFEPVRSLQRFETTYDPIPGVNMITVWSAKKDTVDPLVRRPRAHVKLEWIIPSLCK